MMLKRIIESQKLSKQLADGIIPQKYEQIAGDERKVSRLIFHNCEFLEYELTLLEFLKEKILKKKIKIPKGVDDGTLLRFLYSSYYDQDKACEQLKSYFIWMQDKKGKEINENALIYYQKNFINLVGRDKFQKPLILFDLKQLETKKDIQEMLFEAVEFLFIYLKKYLLYPGVVEKWNIIIDLTGEEYITFNSFDFNMLDFIQKISKLAENFPETLEKVFIINPNKDFVNIYWKPLDSKNLIPSTFKEKMLVFSDKPNEKIPGFSFKMNPLKDLLNFINPTYVPQIYGGLALKFPNLLSGVYKKVNSDDFMLDFDHLIRELQALEIEKKKKQLAKEQLWEEVLKNREEVKTLMDSLRKENELLIAEANLEKSMKIKKK